MQKIYKNEEEEKKNGHAISSFDLNRMQILQTINLCFGVNYYKKRCERLFVIVINLN